MRTEQEVTVMPLCMTPMGEKVVVKKVGGNPEVRQHLEKLGFVPGSEVTVMNEASGSLIVNIKESRIAIGRDMAMKIMV